MLPPKSRLPYQDFKIGNYKTVRTPYFSLKIKKNNLFHNRIGVVIGVASAKSAVRRNFWKRQVKAFFAKQPNTGNDFIVIFSKKIKDISKDEFKKELSKMIPLSSSSRV